MSATVADVIETSIEVLKATGWCRGDLGETNIKSAAEDGEHCALGALSAGSSIVGRKVRDEYLPGPRTLYGKSVALVYDELPQAYRDEEERRARQWREDGPIRLSQKANMIARWNDNLTKNGKRSLYAVLRRALKKAAG